jgi:hypothetical protein
VTGTSRAGRRGYLCLLLLVRKKFQRFIYLSEYFGFKQRCSHEDVVRLESTIVIQGVNITCKSRASDTGTIGRGAGIAPLMPLDNRGY